MFHATPEYTDNFQKKGPNSERKLGSSHAVITATWLSQSQLNSKDSKREEGKARWGYISISVLFSFLTHAQKKLKTFTLNTYLATVFQARLCGY